MPSQPNVKIQRSGSRTMANISENLFYSLFYSLLRFYYPLFFILVISYRDILRNLILNM